MLGKGWFPDDVGGLDRYFRELLEHEPEATAVVVGPATDRPDRVLAASRHDAPLLRRIVAFTVLARRAALNASVVDAHFPLYALLPLLSRRIGALPTVVHFQGPWAEENVAQGDDSRLRRVLRRALERAVHRRATRIVVLSSAFRRLLVERYRVSPWRVRVEPPGVDLERFHPGDQQSARRRLGIDEHAFVTVCVRRLVPRMGLDVLVDAWGQALAELPPGAQLLVAGEGPLRGRLEEQVAAAGLDPSIQLLGRIEDDMLVDLYRSADLGVVPTRSFEGFGLVVLEAAACGTPTIVTRAGGLPEAVAGLGASLTVAPGDACELAVRIVQAARPGGLPGRVQTRLFAEGYSWERVASRNRAVHREAISPATVDRRMRVVYLDHVAQLSGAEIALLRLVPHLGDVEPHVILAEDGHFADALVAAGISTEVLPMLERARALRKDRVTVQKLPVMAIVTTLVYTVRLALYLRRLQPDLVHTNSLKAGVYGSLAARLARIPVVWHVRERIADDYLPSPAVVMVRLMTRRLATAVITNSRANLEALDPHGRQQAVASIVPEALIPPATLAPREPGPLTVGMIGRFAPVKGQDLFLRAFAKAFEGTDARCVLVGAALFGEDEFEARLHTLAGELGLADRVEFRGFRADIWPELARLDMLVHATLIPEPFGQVVLEGMAARVPVLATDAGGPAEIITHDVNGILYPLGDEGELAEALRALSEDPARRARLADAGSASLAAYHPDRVAMQLEQVYRDVIRREGA